MSVELLTTDNLDYGALVITHLLTEITIALTVDISSSVNNEGYVGQWGSLASDQGWLIAARTTDNILFAVHNNTVPVFKIFKTNTNDITGLVRIVCTWHSGDDVIKIWVNGVEKTIVQETGGDPIEIQSSTEKIFVGKDNNRQAVDGDFSEFAIWNHRVPEWVSIAYGKGYSPNIYRKGGLLYSKLVNTSNLLDEWGGVDPTDTGGADAAHPTVKYIAPPHTFRKVPAPVGEDIFESVTSVMDLVSSATGLVDIERTLNSVLALTQTARASFIAKSASNVLALNQLAQATISFNDVITPSVENTLALTQTAQLRHSFDLSANNILALDAIATNDSILSHSAANTLALIQTVAENFVLASAANVLALTQVGDAGKNLPTSVSNVLALSQELANNFRLHSASSALALSQSVISDVNAAKVISVSNTLALTDTATFVRDLGRAIPTDVGDDQSRLQLVQAVVVAHNIRVNVANTLGLVSAVQLKEHNEAVQSFLSLSQKAGRSIPVSASNALFLQQEACRIFKLSSQLNLFSSVSPVSTKEAASVLSLIQTATVLSDFTRSLSQNLGIRQSVGFAIIPPANTPNLECTYSPFVGEVTSGITPPPTTQPVLGTATLTLTHPFVSPTTTLVLRNPELNNSERFQFARINRTTRGGDLKIFSDSAWPKQETLKVQIEALTTAQKDSLGSFFEDNIGLEVGLLDDEDRQWKGIITQPDADFTDVSGNGCTYSVIFEFEGKLQ